MNVMKSAIALFTLALLGGCSAPTPVVQNETPGADASVLTSVPQFSGPWAAEFSSAYQKAPSDFVRSVLADEQITDQELAEMRDQFGACLNAHGFIDVKYGDDGSLDFTVPQGADPDEVNDQTHACSVESGEVNIGSLSSWIRRNPQHQDENTIMAACLVRKGAVDPSYSAQDYANDAPTQSFPYLTGVDGQTVFAQCNADPLGLFE